MSKTLIVIIGPTAVGKTALSIDLAKALQTEIISADSRQFYKEIGIGTAKPTIEEMDGVPHHFVDFLPLDSDYSAGQYEKEALNIIEELFKKKEHVILSGGSGLFVRAVCSGLDDTPRDLNIRKQLNERHGNEGLDNLVTELCALDAEAEKRIDLKNPQRVIRALEVCLVSGRPYSTFLSGLKKTRPFNILTVGLRRSRENLYDRINQRADIMMNEGWLEECHAVIDKRHLNALNTVGYKEIFRHIDGELSFDACLELVKQKTRNFAKRQMTYFKSMDDVHWIDLPNDQASQTIQELLSKFEPK